jgi:hypothetical protein
VRLDKKNVNERWMPYSRNFARRLLGASPATKQSFGREKQVRRCRQSEMWWVSRGNGFGRFQSTNDQPVIWEAL